jgi:hypothetical protein
MPPSPCRTLPLASQHAPAPTAPVRASATSPPFRPAGPKPPLASMVQTPLSPCGYRVSRCAAGSSPKPPPHSLSSAAACSSCQPPHLSSVFPRRSPPSRACPSAADADRLPSPRPRLRRLDVAGEGLSPCATSPPHRPRAGPRSRAGTTLRASREGERRACASPARWPWRGLPYSVGRVLMGRCVRPARQGRGPHANSAHWPLNFFSISIFRIYSNPCKFKICVGFI